MESCVATGFGAVTSTIASGGADFTIKGSGDVSVIDGTPAMPTGETAVSLMPQGLTRARLLVMVIHPSSFSTTPLPEEVAAPVTVPHCMVRLLPSGLPTGQSK